MSQNNQNNQNQMYVSVVGLFAPSIIRYSQSAKDWYVQMLCLKPSNRIGERPGTQDVIRVRAANLELLRKEILRRWPAAAFTNLNTEAPAKGSVEEAREAYLAERSSQPAPEVLNIRGIAAILEEAFPKGTRVTRQMAVRYLSPRQLDAFFGKFGGVDEIEDGPTQDDKVKQRAENVLEFMRSRSDLSTRGRFFSWHDSANWKTLLAYFQALNIEVPTVDEVGRAYRYLSEGNYLHQQEVYKRSEENLRPRVFDPSSLTASNVVTPEQLQEAKRKLSKFSGRLITPAMALTVITRAELDAISNETSLAKADAIARADAKSSFSKPSDRYSPRT